MGKHRYPRVVAATAEKLRLYSCPDPTTGCILWTGPKHPCGYGYITATDAKPTVAHRAAWINARGPIAKGLFVCHKCDNPPCINPDHLFLGTHADNMRDMAAKGRASRPSAKLTAEAVREIRESTQTSISLAQKFGVRPSAIRKAKAGSTWRHA